MSKTEVGSTTSAAAVLTGAGYVNSLSFEPFLCTMNISVSHFGIDAVVKLTCSIPLPF